MAADDLGGDREFRYPLSLLEVAVDGLLAAMSFTYIVIFCIAIPLVAARAKATGVPEPVPPVFLAGAFICIFVLGPSLCDIAYQFGRHRRARVLVTRVGITVSDWRGRDERLFWEQVEELRSSRARWVAFRASALVVVGDGREVAIARGVEDRDELRDEIAVRAGLVRADESWSRERYIRREGA